MDYLRAMACMVVMIFHYFVWAGKDPGSTAFLNRGALYSVPVFYILSGFTLFYIYHESLTFNRKGIWDYTRKRFFRIFPLLWLSTFATLILGKIHPEPFKLFLNLTGLFGLFDWNGYYATGAWSLGNEMVYYLLFPLFIYLNRKNERIFLLTGLIILLIFLIFDLNIINSEKGPFVEQWCNFVNPLNHLLFFYTGILLGKFYKKNNFKNVKGIYLIISGLAIFIFYPVSGERINLISGIDRLVFTFLCIIISVGFISIKKRPVNLPERGLSLLGEASYSVYLLHPLVFDVMGKIFRQLIVLSDLRIFLCILFTLLISYLSFTYFEKYFIRLSHKEKHKIPA